MGGGRITRARFPALSGGASPGGKPALRAAAHPRKGALAARALARCGGRCECAERTRHAPRRAWRERESESLCKAWRCEQEEPLFAQLRARRQLGRRRWCSLRRCAPRAPARAEEDSRPGRAKPCLSIRRRHSLDSDEDVYHPYSYANNSYTFLNQQL